MADGIVVHNCTNHPWPRCASQTQADAPVGERSCGSIGRAQPRDDVDVPRFAEYHQYNIIVTENAVDARQWTCGTPDSRDEQPGLRPSHRLLQQHARPSDPRRVQTLHDFAAQSQPYVRGVLEEGHKVLIWTSPTRRLLPEVRDGVGAVQAFKPTKVRGS